MILTRSTRLSQPQGPVAVDYSSPFSRGLVGYINPALRDAKQIGNPSYSKTPGGIAIAGTGSSLLFKSVPSFSNGATILFVGNWLTGGSHIASIGNSGSGDQCFIFQAGSTGTSRPRALIRTSAGGGVTTAESLGSGNDTQYDQIEVWCARYDGTTALKLYRNGEDYTDGNANTAASGSISTLNNIGLGGTNRGSDSFAAAGQLQTLGLYWNRALSDDEIRVIGRNPWQLFRPAQRRVYFDMGVGGTTEVTTEGTNSVQLSTSGSGYIGQEHLLVSSSSAQLGTLTAMGIAQAGTLSGNPLVQAITSVGGAVTQISILSGEATASSSGTSPGAVQQVNKLLGSACLSPSSASSAGMLQVSDLAAIPNAQLLLTTAAGILQSHVLLGGATFQSSYATSGGMSLTPLIELSADVVQAQSLSGAGQVSQDHKLSHGQSEQPATSSNGATVQTHVLVSSNAVQFVLSSSEAVVVEERGLLQGSSVSQGNTITLGVILQGNILRGTSARQLTLSSSGAITQTGVLPPLTDAELREILAGMQLAIARLQVRLDAMY